ncbi:MAG TPA: zeta toxin family protein [Candidatus Sumerlaeota bacterium]|nr:zeta toxin family protein [Candidatus Sumerlaeota bacterium]
MINNTDLISPVVYVITGPNGAGKTTFALEFLPRVADCRTFINADYIAKGLSPLDADTAAMEAGRLFLRQIRSFINERKTFAFESTLSGKGYVHLFNALKEKGYSVHLYYLWLQSCDLALKRIVERKRRGGHGIPKDVVERRFARSLKNLFKHYMPLADYCAIFDNSSSAPKLLFTRTLSQEHILDRDKYEFILKQSRGEA